MEAAALREDSAGVRGDATDDQLPAWHFQPFDAARKHVSHIWTAPRRHLIRCQRRRWCRSLEKTHWFPNGCIVAKRRFSLWTVNDLIWAPDVAFRLAERSLREAEGGRGTEREREGWGNDRKERNSLAYDSQQQPRHLTALSWLCVCASLLFFFPLVYHDSWMKINLLLHLPSWVLGSADGPSLSHWARWQPTNSGLCTTSVPLFSNLILFFLSSLSVFCSLIRCSEELFFLIFFCPAMTSPSHSDSRCLGPFEGAIWALITLIDGSEGPCCSSEWQIKAFLDNVGNWLNRL